MSLQNCPECGKRVSSYAEKCPQCGYSIAATENSNSKREHNNRDYLSECPQIMRYGQSNNQYNNPKTEDDRKNNYRKEDQSQKKQRKAVLITTLTVIALIAFFAIRSFSPKNQSTNTALPQSTVSPATQSTEYIQYTAKPTSTPRATASTQKIGYSVYDDDLKVALIDYAMKKVKNHLLSPSTAKFPSYSECSIQKGADNVYSIVGYVDATNAYGAVIRTTWGAMIQYDGTYSSVVMIQVGDDMYFD